MGESLQRCLVAWRQPQCDMRRCDHEAKGRRLGERKRERLARGEVLSERKGMKG